jgi:hypothetical protein
VRKRCNHRHRGAHATGDECRHADAYHGYSAADDVTRAHKVYADGADVALGERIVLHNRARRQRHALRDTRARSPQPQPKQYSTWWTATHREQRKRARRVRALTVERPRRRHHAHGKLHPMAAAPRDRTPPRRAQCCVDSATRQRRSAVQGDNRCRKRARVGADPPRNMHPRCRSTDAPRTEGASSSFRRHCRQSALQQQRHSGTGSSVNVATT